MQLAMLHKTVCREEEKTLVCTIMNMAQATTLSVNWTFIGGVMERYTHVYPAALDDDVGFRTDQRSEYIHEHILVLSWSVNYTQLHITNVCGMVADE